VNSRFVNVSEVSKAIKDGVICLIEKAEKDVRFSRRNFFWWSSDIFPVEVTRSTAAVVTALIEFVNTQGAHPGLSIPEIDEVKTKIRGGITWLHETKIHKTEPTPSWEERQPGYQGIIVEGSWMNIPRHIWASMHSSVSARSLEHDGYVRIAVANMGPTIMDVITPFATEEFELENLFDVPSTKEALLALALAKKHDFELDIDTDDDIRDAIRCFENFKCSKLGIWSTKFICMNFHAMFALLEAGGALGSELENSEVIVRPYSALTSEDIQREITFTREEDICTIVSQMLVDYCKGDRSPQTSLDLLEVNIPRLKVIEIKQQNDSKQETSCFPYHGRCAVAQTCWVIYTLSTVLEPLIPKQPTSVTNKPLTKEEWKRSIISQLGNDGYTQAFDEISDTPFEIIRTTPNEEKIKVFDYLESIATEKHVESFVQKVLKVEKHYEKLLQEAQCWASSFDCDPKAVEEKIAGQKRGKIKYFILKGE
jgi:hypothetical protein